MLGHKAVARRPAEKKCGQKQQRPLWSVKPVEFSRCGNRRAVAFELEERYEEGEGFLARKKYKHLGDYWMGRDEICCCYLLWEKTEGAEKYNWLEKKGICYTPYHKRLSMAVYQLWSPWTPLDESFQWLRHTTPKPSSKHPFRASPCFPHTPSDLEVQLCFQEVTLVLDTPFLEPGVSPKLPCHTSELRTMNKKGLVRKSQPVRLSGLDSVFGRVITAQPPKWTSTLRVSDKSAFCKIISQEHQWPTGLKEPQIQMTVTMCKQILHSILLLYATYKKYTFVLLHSK